MSRSLAALSVCLVTALALVAPRSSAAFAAPPPFVTMWGTAGSGNGQFNGPFGITVAGGIVYVVDTGNQRVQYFNTSGGYLGQWGGAGSGNGTFSQPLCVAVDPSGNVYVTDYNLNLVQKFTGTGTFI